MSETAFEVLKLPPTATPEEIVRQGALLCRRTADEEVRNAARQAVRELTDSDDGRVLQALLTPPGPAYEVPALERLTAAHRRPPRAVRQLPVPALDIEEFRALLLSAVAGDDPSAPLPLERIEAAEPAEEVERQTAEALWQSLIGQPRA